MSTACLWINREIVSRGTVTRYPFGHLDEFRQVERSAREAGRGLWGADLKESHQPKPKVRNRPRVIFGQAD